MTEIKKGLMEEKLSTLHLRLLETHCFVPALESILFDLVNMEDESKRLLTTDSSYCPIIQDLLVYLETAQEAIDDAIKDFKKITQEIKK